MTQHEVGGTHEFDIAGHTSATPSRMRAVTQQADHRASDALGVVAVTADFTAKLGRRVTLERQLERERRVLDKQVHAAALWGVVKSAVQGSVAFKLSQSAAPSAVPSAAPSAAPKESQNKWQLAARQLEKPTIATVVAAALGADWSKLRLRQRRREVQRLHDVYVNSAQRGSTFEEILKLYYPNSKRADLLEMESWTVKEVVVEEKEHTVEELLEIRAMFEAIDEDKGGSLELEELIAAGWGGTTDEDQADLERMFNLIDEDGDGSIDIEGFTRLVIECKLLDGDLLTAHSVDAVRSRTTVNQRPSLATLNSVPDSHGKAEQLRLEAPSLGGKSRVSYDS